MSELKPAKLWRAGSQDVETFMPPVATAISRHIEKSDPAWTDIYNRAYEAVYTALKASTHPDDLLTSTRRAKPTNADRIRGMGDEELAKWMRDWIDCDHAGYMCTAKRYKNSKRCDGHCVENHLNWLRQPAEEVHDGQTI